MTIGTCDGIKWSFATSVKFTLSSCDLMWTVKYILLASQRNEL